MPIWPGRARPSPMPHRPGCSARSRSAARIAPRGGQSFAVVDITPGRYLVIDPSRPTLHARFTATETPRTTRSFQAPVPAADLSAGMFDGFVSMPARLPAGRHVWNVTNSATSLRDLAIVPVPLGATTEQAIAAYDARVTGAALPANLGVEWSRWDQNAIVTGTGTVSPGQTVWSQVDLAPGTYVLISTVPTNPGVQSPVPGLMRVFTVTGGLTTG